MKIKSHGFNFHIIFKILIIINRYIKLNINRKINYMYINQIGLGHVIIQL